MDATKVSDCSSVIRAFEKHMLSAPSEGAILGSTLPKVVAINANASAASKQVRALVNPPVPEELLSSFGSESDVAVSASVSFEIPKERGVNKSAELDNWKEWLAKCIPCDLRIDVRAELASNLDDALIELLFQLANAYLKELSFLLSFLNSNDIYADVCQILFALQDICIPDLQRILSLLASILYRMTVREIEATDLLKLLIMPIFQPIFSGLVGMLGQYKLLVTNPLHCVVGNISAQMEKLKVGNILNSDVLPLAAEFSAGVGLTSGVAQDQELKARLQKARQPLDSLDAGIESMQNSLGTALGHLNRQLGVGIAEIEALLYELKKELLAFIGMEETETVEFLLNQYQKLIIFRLIAFITSLVKAFTSGFNCNFSDPTAAQDTIGKFLADFLGPNSQVIVANNELTGDLMLILDPRLVNQIDKNTNISGTLVVDVALPFSTTGSAKIDTVINDIITKSSQPISIKPSCVFEPGTVDKNKFAQWIADLEATGV